MIEYPSSPENFTHALDKVLNGYAHVKLRDKSGKAVVMMHEEEFNAIMGEEPTPRELEILNASNKTEGSVTFNNVDEIYKYFGLEADKDNIKI